MTGDFRKLLDQELAARARKSGRAKPEVSPVADAMCAVFSHALYKYALHVTDGQQTSIKSGADARESLATAAKAYAKALELERRIGKQGMEDGS